MRLMDALRQGRYDILAQAIKDTLEIEIEPDDLKRACLAIPAERLLIDSGPKGFYDRADDTVMMWLRNRLDELGAIPCGKPLLREWLTCELHVGFVGVEETEEHIYNLIKNYESMIQYWESRSRITGCQLELKPIDRVAARVGPREK